MADFGNPLVLGGNFDVLSTEIFFAIVGAQNDPAQAAILAVVLLFFTLAAFYAQRFWLGRRSYTTVSGKGDAGIHPLLPRRSASASTPSSASGSRSPSSSTAPSSTAASSSSGASTSRLTLAHYVKAFARRLERVRPPLARLGLELLLDDDLDRAGLRAADRGDRPAHRLAARPPGLRRQARLRVRDHAVLRHPRHGDRRLLRHRLQRAADRADRHRHHPRALLHLPQHAGRRPRRRRLDVADRPQPRRELADPRRRLLADAAPRRAAAAASRRSSRRWSIPSCAP